MLDSGQFDSGMIPKVQGCLMAAENGVARVHIIDGRVEHSILMEVFTEGGIGTMITSA
jgi:acetylglutamate kinase